MTQQGYYCDPICSGPVFMTISARYLSQLRAIVDATEVRTQSCYWAGSSYRGSSYPFCGYPRRLPETISYPRRSLWTTVYDCLSSSRGSSKIILQLLASVHRTLLMFKYDRLCVSVYLCVYASVRLSACVSVRLCVWVSVSMCLCLCL